MFKKPKTPEHQVDSQVNDLMKYRGWRSVRHQRTAIPGSFSTGEPGMPDRCYIRYFEGGVALVVWIEMKRPGAKRSCRCADKKPGQKCTQCAQADWRRRETARGGIVWQVDSIDALERLYQPAFGWLHSGDNAIGQLDLLAGVPVGQICGVRGGCR